VAGGKETASLTGPRNYLLTVAFAPDGKTLAAAGHEDNVWLWEWKK
jgi:hypothetical protein